jgi:hemerythrin-like domain-containing protein
MKNIVKPIKRSLQLAPLSREHHEGLLFAWKLRQGLENGTPMDTLRNYCHWYWKNHINPHFKQEEGVLLKYLASDNTMATQLLDEHYNIRELILSIADKPDSITIGMLADFISRHIRFEERIVFIYLEKNLSSDELNSIREQLEAEPVCSCDWNEEFWLKGSKNQEN